MMHSFQIRGGRVAYENHFVPSDAYIDVKVREKRGYPSFAISISRERRAQLDAEYQAGRNMNEPTDW